VLVLRTLSNACTQYREDFYVVDRFHSSALDGNWGAACREAHTNFTDESACLTADEVQNEVVNNSQITGVLKMVSLYM
jgi:hypothetical protein